MKSDDGGWGERVNGADASIRTLMDQLCIR